MKKILPAIKKAFILMTLSGIIFTFTACSSFDKSKQNNEYYNQLSENVDTLLMQNRELTKIKADWSYKDKESTEKYMNQLVEIEKTIVKIKNIDASSGFTDFDEENVENNCDIALESLALTKTMAKAAYDTSDSSDFQNTDVENYPKYEKAYNEIISSVGSLRARIR